MKKLFCMVMISAAVLSMTACKSKADTPSAPSMTADSTEKAVEADIKEIHEAVKKAYGENYYPDTAITDQILNEVMGVNQELVEEFTAEQPAISVNSDTFVAIKAKTGKGTEVESALNKYRDGLLADTLQYPRNQVMIKASQVISYGDYVFFVMLGGPSQEAEEKGEEAAFESARESNKIGIDAIAAFFK